jgi:hypothetical protein
VVVGATVVVVVVVVVGDVPAMMLKVLETLAAVA